MSLTIQLLCIFLLLCNVYIGVSAASCPSMPVQITDATLVTPAHLQTSANIPSQCQPALNGPISHCSVFMHSHLRPFHFAHQTYKSIKTCSMPGRWLLFSHETLVVEVEGRVEEADSLHTRLTKVFVHFPPSGDCNPLARSYIAHNDSPLPNNFACSSENHNNTGSPLELHVSEDGTVATLLASWLNSKVVIRKMEGFLTVTLQVTGHMAFESEGFCAIGCPDQQYINAMEYTNSANILENCSEERNMAFINCFLVVGQNLQNVRNISYNEACIYSMLQSESRHTSLIFQAIIQDANRLRDTGIVPSPLISTRSTVSGVYSSTRRETATTIASSDCNLSTTSTTSDHQYEIQTTGSRLTEESSTATTQLERLGTSEKKRETQTPTPTMINPAEPAVSRGTGLLHDCSHFLIMMLALIGIHHVQN